MPDFEANDNEALIECAQVSVGAQEVEPGKLYSVHIPKGAQREVLDTRKYLLTPLRKQEQVVLFTAASFSAYVKVHTGPGTSLFADDRSARIVGVLNGLSADETGWSDHVATLGLRKTPEWDRWAKRSGHMMPQGDFAELIEEGLAEIHDPPAADMLELAQNFEAAVKVVFKESRLLANGQRQLTYEETIDARAGEKGQIIIPREFKLGLRPYEGGDAYAVLARLRYRISDGRLSIGYALDRPEDVLKAAFEDVTKVVEETTGLACYAGLQPS